MVLVPQNDKMYTIGPIERPRGVGNGRRRAQWGPQNPSVWPNTAWCVRFWPRSEKFITRAKIPVILSINTSNDNFFGDFGPFFFAFWAISAILGQNGVSRGGGGPGGQMWVFEAPDPLGTHFMSFFKKKFEKNLPILAQKDLESFRPRAKK